MNLRNMIFWLFFEKTRNSRNSTYVLITLYSFRVISDKTEKFVSNDISFALNFNNLFSFI